MNYRANYKYHVMNCSSGVLAYSSDSYQEAIDKALTYTKNSGHTHQILERRRTINCSRTVEIVDENEEYVDGSVLADYGLDS